MPYKDDGVVRRPGAYTFAPFEKELNNFFMITIGNMKKYSFNIEKKD
jgi:hypothetical protein